MPLTIQPGRTPSCARLAADAPRHAPEHLIIGLVNNMPDAALEATAAQFSRLLRSAAGPWSVELRLAYLPEVPRGSEAQDHLAHAYWHIDELLLDPLDGLIVTGLEPLAASLRDEPYWERLCALVTWAEHHTHSSIWSCLAAHAAVQSIDGISRRRLERKRFGVFGHSVLSGHPLTRGIGTQIWTPHSRWNELPVRELRAAGYTIVSSSPETGADIFLRHRGSLFVFFQGHPEYDVAALFKEYRRDVGRFLRGEREQFPEQPQGYFPPDTARELDAFREQALAVRSADLMSRFPSTADCARITDTWGTAAVRIYGNWLSLIAAAKHPTDRVVSVEV